MGQYVGVWAVWLCGCVPLSRLLEILGFNLHGCEHENENAPLCGHLYSGKSLVFIKTV